MGERGVYAGVGMSFLGGWRGGGRVVVQSQAVSLDLLGYENMERIMCTAWDPCGYSTPVRRSDIEDHRQYTAHKAEGVLV